MVSVLTHPLLPKSVAMLILLKEANGLQYGETEEAELEEELLAWGSELLARTFDVGGVSSASAPHVDAPETPTFRITCPSCGAALRIELQFLKEFADALQNWGRDHPGFISFFPGAGPTPAHEALRVEGLAQADAPPPVEPAGEYEKSRDLLKRLLKRKLVRRIGGRGSQKPKHRRQRGK